MDTRRDVVAARATGVGTGLVAFLGTWLVADMVTEGPVAAGLAIVVGVVYTVVASNLLVQTISDPTTTATTTAADGAEPSDC